MSLPIAFITTKAYILDRDIVLIMGIPRKGETREEYNARLKRPYYIRIMSNQATRERYLRHKHETYLRSRDKRLSDGRKENRILRTLAIDKLGGKCKVCGIKDQRVLQIDHINGKGQAERARGIGYVGIYRKIRDQPLETVCTTYQLLCANCNWIKRFERHEHNQFDITTITNPSTYKPRKTRISKIVCRN